MNRWPVTVAGGLVLSLAYGAQDSYLATSHIASWEFMQSVGGIGVGEPSRTDKGGWVLPVVCDVSGLRKVTREPTKLNSGLAVTRMLHQVSAAEIRISVVLNAPLGSSPSSRCTEISLGGINTGAYRVVYEEPNGSTHSVGTIRLK